ncbi:MAG: hypothetical protein ACWA5L_11600 [bacterium]
MLSKYKVGLVALTVFLSATPAYAQLNHSNDYKQTDFPPLLENIDKKGTGTAIEAALVQRRQRAISVLDLLESSPSAIVGEPPALEVKDISAEQQQLERSLPSRDLKQYRPPQRRQTTVDMASAKQYQQIFTQQGVEQSDNIYAQYKTKCEVPVLMPERANSRSIFFSKQDFYHGVVPGNGYRLSYHGTRLVSVTSDQKSVGQDLNIFQTYDGMAASFSLFGAAYSIILSCDQPQSDPRCRSEAFMKGRIADLAIYLNEQSGGGQ